jgi:large subunit ribosomal protein L15
LLARSGGGKQPGFEGGQMPLIRRVPKFGFRNPTRIEYAVVNLDALSRLSAGDPVTPQMLVEGGLVKHKTWRVKILGNGELTRPLVIQAHKFSKSAEAKIQAAGGRAEVIRGV